MECNRSYEKRFGSPPRVFITKWNPTFIALNAKAGTIKGLKVNLVISG